MPVSRSQWRLDSISASFGTRRRTSFCAQSGCTDGSEPWGGLVQATNGECYGTTMAGGAYSEVGCAVGCGTVFSLSVGLVPGPFAMKIARVRSSRDGLFEQGLERATCFFLFAPQRNDGGTWILLSRTCPRSMNWDHDSRPCSRSLRYKFRSLIPRILAAFPR